MTERCERWCSLPEGHTGDCEGGRSRLDETCTMNARCNACERSILGSVPDRICSGREDCALKEWRAARHLLSELETARGLLREAAPWLATNKLNRGHHKLRDHLGDRVRAWLARGDETSREGRDE